MSAMDPLLAQTIIAEMASEHNQLVDYCCSLVLPPPGLDHFNVSRDLYAVETQLATWKEAMRIVARHAGINLDLTPVKAERKKRK